MYVNDDRLRPIPEVLCGDSYLVKDIGALQISVRSIEALRRNNFNFVAQIIAVGLDLEEKNFSQVASHGLGKTGITALQKSLYEQGYQFNMVDLPFSLMPSDYLKDYHEGNRLEKYLNENEKSLKAQAVNLKIQLQHLTSEFKKISENFEDYNLIIPKIFSQQPDPFNEMKGLLDEISLLPSFKNQADLRDMIMKKREDSNRNFVRSELIRIFDIV